MRRLSREQVVYSMSKEAEPVISVAPGEELLIETEDCFSFQLRQPGDRLGAFLTMPESIQRQGLLR